MAISKILYIGDCGAGYSGKHLSQAINYITIVEKTGGGRWISAINCQKENVYEQMRSTKEEFGKTDKRQGYHLIISFVEGEVDAQTAFEVIGRFAKEYLGQDYEAVYAVHNNTDHIHGHILFNSVSFRTGNKYRYKKGDWAKHIQPITNRLCEEYGLSTIEISEDRAVRSENYKEWNDFRDGKFVWSDMIKRDLDACIMQAATYESFLDMLVGMGYEIKNATKEVNVSIDANASFKTSGKYLAIKPMGLSRFRRCKTLGENYTEERIRERIISETIADHETARIKNIPQIVRCRVKRYRKAKMSGLQKRYFAKLYQTGKLKKRPYSQAYKYRDDIRKMQQLQDEYLFLSRHDISSMAELVLAAEGMTEKKKEVLKEKSRVYKERARFKTLFDIMDEMECLKDFENSFQRGEKLFEKEHERMAELKRYLGREGYTVERLQSIKEHYRNEIALVIEKEKAVVKEERIARLLIKELIVKGDEAEKDKALKESRERHAEKGKTTILHSLR